MEFVNTRAGLLADEQQITALLDARQASLDAALEENGHLAATLVALRAEYDAHLATHAPVGTLRIGMNAVDQWDQRLAQVGAEGITARRIFNDNLNDPRARDTQVQAAIRDGMMPILSFKGTPTTANVAALRSYLVGLGVPVTATYHHEPRTDMDPAVFRQRSLTFLGVQAPNVKVGPLLNGWLLDGKVPEFTTYTSAELLDRWDFMGIDTYETNGRVPGDRIAPLLAWLNGQGHPDKPIVIGEYNGKTAASIVSSGQTFLSTPQIMVACIWNALGSGSAEATPLSGARLEAFKATKADPRVIK